MKQTDNYWNGLNSSLTLVGMDESAHIRYICTTLPFSPPLLPPINLAQVFLLLPRNSLDERALGLMQRSLHPS